MRRGLAVLGALLLFSVSVAGCEGYVVWDGYDYPSPPPPYTEPTVTSYSSGCAAFEFAASGSLVFFLVSESESFEDLNGDGDTNDPVLFLWDTADPLTAAVSSGISAAPGSLAASDGRWCFFAVGESAEGGTDFNLDGDTNDEAVAVWDGAAPGTPPTVAARSCISSRLLASGSLVFFRVSEGAEGLTDLNGDADKADGVLYVWDGAAAVTPPSGSSLAATSDFVASGSLVFFRVSEGGQGNADRNGDGDTADSVVAVWDGATPLVAPVSSGCAANGNSLEASSGYAFFAVSEAAQGASGTDFNADGDRFDSAPAVWNGATPGTPPTVAPRAMAGDAMASSGSLVFFRVGESVDNFQDHNADGDTTDAVLFVWDGATPGTPPTNSGVSAESGFVATGGFCFFTVSEGAEGSGGTDLNADADAIDSVLHLYDGAFPATPPVNSAVAASTGTLVASGGHYCFFGAPEAAQGLKDLNLDGDVGDLVLGVWDALSPATEPANSGGALLASTLSAEGSLAVWGIPEGAQGGWDLNGDLDNWDTVVYLWDATSPSDGPYSSQVALAGTPAAASLGGVFLASEGAQGVDLNGDLDTWDAVLAFAVRP